MINLLPDNTRKDIYRSYTLRLLALGLAFAGAILFLGALGLVPATIGLRSEIAYEEAILPPSLPSDTGIVARDPVTVAQEVSRRIRILSQPDTTGALLPHEAIALVLSHKGKVALESFTYAPERAALVIRGTAPNRTDLLLFSHALEGDMRVASIDLPVETLLAEGERPFTISIVFKTAPLKEDKNP